MKNLVVAVLALSCLMAAAPADDHASGAEKSYPAKEIAISGLIGEMHVDVSAYGPAKLQISGTPERVGQIDVRLDGTTLQIRDEAATEKKSGWGWLHKLLADRDDVQAEGVKIHLVMPEHAPLTVTSLTGNARIGNTHGPLVFKIAGKGSAQIGDVRDADIAIAGAGKVHLGAVAGTVSSAIAGSGSLATGNISGGLSSKIAGSGYLFAASVHGPVKIKIAGMGNVRIADGEADPFRVKIAGQGDVRFNGVAHNPVIRAVGMAQIQVKKYTGPLGKSGNVDFSVGYMSMGKAPDGDW